MLWRDQSVANIRHPPPSLPAAWPPSLWRPPPDPHAAATLEP